MSYPKLITNLLRPDCYPHPVSTLQVLDTHISWVILTGDYAYKIKKPVDFEFLNYSTLALRSHFCQEEVRLNQALAQELYCGVVSITGDMEQPKIDGTGPIIEYAVKMRQFAQEDLFTELLAREELTLPLINQLADQIATFHQQTSTITPDPFLGTPEQVHAPVLQNFDQIRPLLHNAADLEKLAQLQQWAEQEYQRLYTALQQRQKNHFIRECHGDIHLGNIILRNQQPMIFDCIEFNTEFRWIDVMADIGFLIMDLEQQVKPALANRLLNRYLEITGDYSGLHVLNYYKAYRAMVRAKVMLFSITTDEQQAQECWKKYRSCITLAMHYAEITKPALLITQGISGTGKSTIAKLIVAQYGAIQIRSDIERKRLYGMTAEARNHCSVLGGIYDTTSTEKTYQHLLELSENIIQSGYKVVVDATFLLAEQRQLFKQLAQKYQIPFSILHCAAPTAETHCTWIRERDERGDDPSEAYPEVIAMQEQMLEAITNTEQADTMTISLCHDSDIIALFNYLDSLFNHHSINEIA